MNRHYDRYLVRKYAPLYRDRYGDMRTTSMCWGFEVGDGWFNIINELSRLLCDDWLSAKERFEFLCDNLGKQIWRGRTVKQKEVDEAYSKMIEEEKKVPVVTQVKEKYGTLRFYIDGGTDEHYSLIRMAEGMSSVTCEVCGSKGKRNYYGWISTRCPEHRNNLF